MPTKTKPKVPTSVYMHRVRFDKDQRSEIIDLLGLDEAPISEQNVLVETLEDYLMYPFNMLARLPHRPMPAHIKVELEKMLSPAQKLANSISSGRLTPEARSCLGDVDTGDLWYQLTYLILDIEFAVQRLDKSGRKSDGGALNQRDSETRQSIREYLEKFFDKNARSIHDKMLPSENYKDDFIELCMSKLPVPPSYNQKASNSL
jgi:hypothetical protein